MANGPAPVKYPIPLILDTVNAPCWCGSILSDILCRADRWGQPLTTVACRNCGTVRLDPRMTSEQAAAYYQTMYPDRQNDPKNIFEEQQRSGRASAIAPFLGDRMHILDYGCGPGGKLAALKRQGHIVYGHDLNQAYTAYSVKQGLLPHIAGQRYDCIYLAHTIEHWIEPLSDIAQLLRQCLRPCGLVIIEVPFLDRLLLGARRNGIQGDTYLPHTYYFSVRSLDKLMKQVQCERRYTDRVTLSVYQHKPNLPQRNIPATPIRDKCLRWGISMCSVPWFGWTARKINRVTRYIDVYQDTTLRCLSAREVAA